MIDAEKQNELMDLKPLYRAYREFALRAGGVSDREALACAFLDSWSAESAMPEFAREWRPCWFGRGQDDVTALIAAELADGEMAVDRFGIFNLLPVGEGHVHVDFCRPAVVRGRGACEYLSRLDLLRGGGGVRLTERYLTLRQRMHFVMARAIR